MGEDFETARVFTSRGRETATRITESDANIDAGQGKAEDREQSRSQKRGAVEVEWKIATDYMTLGPPARSLKA